MRILTTVAFLAIGLIAQSQNLKNSEWTLLKASRKDGSTIISHASRNISGTKYFFKSDSVLLGANAQYDWQYKFSVDSNILTIGPSRKYKIDEFNDVILSITDIGDVQDADDQLIHFVFINNNSLFDFLYQNRQLEIIGDSLIHCNNLFSPVLKGDLSKMVAEEFGKPNFTDKVIGNFIMSETGAISNIYVSPHSKLSKREQMKIVRVIQATEGSWSIPTITMPLQFKIDFTVSFEYSRIPHSTGFLTGINVILFDTAVGKLLHNTHDPIFTNMLNVENYYAKGLDLYNHQKFEKAAHEFDKCIKTDSLYVDAYYNLALCYQQLGNIKSACEVWAKLKAMGQKDGENLYQKNCK